MGLPQRMSENDQSEQTRVRFEKLESLREEGFSFPNDVQTTVSSEQVKATCELEKDLDAEKRSRFSVSGRIMAIRKMGKASFCHIQDPAGRLQCYVRRDDVGEESYKSFKSWDVGDLIHLEGYPFFTKTEEPSLHATSVKLLVKCLHPLPEKWHGLSDVEVRYRKRYLDLIVNPDVREVFIKRAGIVAAIRSFFNSKGYVEVETPMMSGIVSGASARPFNTHHNSLDLDLSLRIALELPLKKLVVGGIERVFELGRVFRNEGISTEHNPEFTMIEFYQAYATYEDLMELTEELVLGICDDVIGSRKVKFGDHDIDYSGPWKRMTMVDSIHEVAGVSSDVNLGSIEGVHQAAKELGSEDLLEEKDYGKAVFELFDRHVESKLIDPVFITQHPLSVSPLARKSDQDPRFTDRFELFIAGMEVANAFSELNDPVDQRERFESQMKLKAGGDDEAMSLDEDFLAALEFGMPPTAGEGIGIDRLVMLLTGSQSIRDVILFPQMRPESSES